MKTTAKRTKTLVIFSILMMVGCATQEPRYVTKYVPQKVCFQESAHYSAEFSYPCEDKKIAQVAGVICDGMAGTAGILIETNREIGPTSARNLLETAIRGEQGRAIKAFYDTLQGALGETVAKAYIEDILDMSVYIADRNITDRVTYPNQKYRSCVTTFNYAVE